MVFYITLIAPYLLHTLNIRSPIQYPVKVSDRNWTGVALKKLTASVYKLCNKLNSWFDPRVFDILSIFVESATLSRICFRKITVVYGYLQGSGIQWVEYCSYSRLSFVDSDIGITDFCVKLCYIYLRMRNINELTRTIYDDNSTNSWILRNEHSDTHHTIRFAKVFQTIHHYKFFTWRNTTISHHTVCP